MEIKLHTYLIFGFFIIFVGTNYSMKFIMMIIIMIDLETKEKNFTKKYIFRLINI